MHLRPPLAMLRAVAARAPPLARPLQSALLRPQSAQLKTFVGPRPQRPWKLHGFGLDVDAKEVKALLKERDAALEVARRTGDYSAADELRERLANDHNVSFHENMRFWMVEPGPPPWYGRDGKRRIYAMRTQSMAERAVVQREEQERRKLKEQEDDGYFWTPPPR